MCVRLPCWCPRNMLHFPSQYLAPNSPNTQVITREARKEAILGSVWGVLVRLTGKRRVSSEGSSSGLRPMGHPPGQAVPSLSLCPCSGHLSSWKVLTQPSVAASWLCRSAQGSDVISLSEAEVKFHLGSPLRWSQNFRFLFIVRRKFWTLLFHQEKLGAGWWVAGGGGAWFTPVVANQQNDWNYLGELI